MTCGLQALALLHQQLALLGDTVSIKVSGESAAERVQRVPFRVQKDELVGRGAVIASLMTKLTSARSLHAAVGMSGVGKSMVAAAVAKELKASDVVQCAFFMQADSRNTLMAELVRFGKSYVQDCDLHSSNEEAVQASAEFLEKADIEWLIVLDDVQDWDDVKDLVSLGQHGRILVTSTSRNLNGFENELTELDLFETDESMAVSWSG